MRIAISGSHFSGKTTLVAALLQQLPDYVSIDEPYRILEEAGYEFSDPPSIDDFEQQLDCSIRFLKKSSKNTLFDRSPLDFLAYAQVLAERFDLEEWIEKIRKPLQKLDLIVFVPIEDRIPVPPSENTKLRKKVDQKLQEFLLEDSLGLLYRAQEGLVNLDCARQSKIDPNERDHCTPCKASKEDRFGKVAASPNSPNLTKRGIEQIEVIEVAGSLEKRVHAVLQF